MGELPEKKDYLAKGGSDTIGDEPRGNDVHTYEKMAGLHAIGQGSAALPRGGVSGPCGRQEKAGRRVLRLVDPWTPNSTRKPRARGTGS